MKLNYIKTSPSQNMTILITDYIDSKDYIKVANSVMRYESLYAEQVGFVVPPKHNDSCVGICMAGGEFCGNALLSAAAYSRYKGICLDENFFVSSSGSKDALKCKINVLDLHRFKVFGQVPNPLDILPMDIKVDNNIISGNLVVMNGISHFITDYAVRKEEFDKIMNQLINSVESSALGIIPFKSIDETNFEINPYVFVKNTGSRYFERACGSGSLSLGIHLNNFMGIKQARVHQSGGIIDVEISDKNYISTEVTIISEGTVYI